MEFDENVYTLSEYVIHSTKNIASNFLKYLVVPLDLADECVWTPSSVDLYQNTEVYCCNIFPLLNPI